jgi:uncharacterized protein YuzE
MMVDVTYDAAGDVLYVIWTEDVSIKGTETADGMVKRYDAAGHLLGVTVMDFAARLRVRIADDDLTARMEKRANDAVR